MDVVNTSVVRFIQTRMELTHQERGICVISGSWGIGKTTAANWFACQHSGSCIVVKIEPGSMKRGASPIFVLQQTLEAMRPHLGRSRQATLSNAYWSLRQLLYSYLCDWRSQHQHPESADIHLTLVFDEAQYLSRHAIEMLRYWNDPENAFTPFPLALIFIGNSEFALDENAPDGGAISGAVRSRALFIETLDYGDVDDADILSFLGSLGPYEDRAKEHLLSYFKRPRIRRDFRTIAHLDAAFRRRCGKEVVDLELVRSILN